MMKLGKNPANDPFYQPYGATRANVSPRMSKVAEDQVRQLFPYGFTTNPYDDDRAARSFSSSGGSVAGLGMYGRDLVITGDRRKLSYFARGNANRFGVAHTPGALMGLADAAPVMQMDPLTITGHIRPPCDPGYREVSTSDGQVCITDQTSNSGSTLDSAIDSAKNFFKSIFGGGSKASTGYKLSDKDEPLSAPPLVQADVSDVSAAVSNPSEWANPFPDRAAAVSRPTPSAFASLGTVGTVGLALGGVGVVYGLMKHKPKIAVAAAAVGVAALVLPKLMGNKNPFA